MMSDGNPAAQNAGKGDGSKRKRSYRNRRRNRKPPTDRRDPQAEEDSGRSGSKSSRRNGAAKKTKAGESATLDPVKRARRDRRRRKRLGGDGPGIDAAPPAPMPELDIEPKRVFIYTHVVRPALRDAYEYRAEHFTHSGRTLDDFRIDLSGILVYPNGNTDLEPTIDLHIGGIEGISLGDDESWDDEEPSEEQAPGEQAAAPD